MRPGPQPYPMKWPELTGPPRVASAAPAWSPLQLTAYRGVLPPDLRGAVPHLLAFEQERKTPVVAITDEPGETLDAFFAALGKPLPERVATDAARRASLAYGAGGTPTFVLVDGDGVIRSYSVGYSPAKGLGVEDWRWSGAAPGTRP